MSLTEFNVRAKMKIDTTARWAANRTFIPLKGEIVVYSDYATKEVNGQTVNVPNFKVGDGMAYCVDLPFVNDDLRDILMNHIADSSSHVSAADREFWNNKVRCYLDTEEDNDGYLVDGETIVFTTH